MFLDVLAESDEDVLSRNQCEKMLFWWLGVARKDRYVKIWWLLWWVKIHFEGEFCFG